MQNMKTLETEGKAFLEIYQGLPDMAKMNVNAYMRGLKDGRRMADTENKKKELVAV